MHAALRLPDGRLLGAPPQADRNRSARLLVAPEVAARRYRFPFQVLDDLLEHRHDRRVDPRDRLPVLGLGQFPSSAIKDKIVGNADAEHTARRRRGGLFRVDPPLRRLLDQCDSPNLESVAYCRTSAIRVATWAAWAAMPWALKCTPSADQHSGWSLTKPNQMLHHSIASGAM